MNDKRPDLKQLQQWTQTVITHPGGIQAGVVSEDARASIEVSPGDLESVVTRSAKLTGAERLGIYGRAYHARLLECMRAEYPCLQHFLGEDLFSRFVFEYLQARPPSSNTLHDLGRRFPDYLTATRPNPDQHADQTSPWPDLVVDLARLERAVFEVYDGPGVEGQSLPTGEDLHMMPDSLKHSAQLTPVVCLRVMAFRFPVRQYSRDVQRLGDADLPLPKESYVVMTRRDFVVHVDKLSREQHLLLHELSAGMSVGDAIGQVVSKAKTSNDEMTRRTWDWLGECADRSYFAAIG